MRVVQYIYSVQSLATRHQNREGNPRKREGGETKIAGGERCASEVQCECKSEQADSAGASLREQRKRKRS